MPTLDAGNPEHPVLRLQHTLGNQALQRLLQTHVDKSEGELVAAEPSHFRHDFSRIPVHSPPLQAVVQRSPASVERKEQRRAAFREELAKWPDEAHRQWKRLPFPERVDVMERMGKYYGGDFAARFLQYRASPSVESFHEGPGFPEHTRQWFLARGYRLAQTSAGLDSVVERWVHPSGKLFVKIRELQPDDDMPPQSVEEKPSVIDPPPPDFPTDIPEEPIDFSGPGAI